MKSYIVSPSGEVIFKKIVPDTAGKFFKKVCKNLELIKKENFNEKC